MSESPLEREYYAIVKAVSDLDARVLTVKGWGVTLSLAALAWGFQYTHYGMFLVAALSGLSFWLIEGAFKRHQMRYYLRMREIEVLEFGRAQEEGSGRRSSPRIDWGWREAARVYAGKAPRDEPVPLTGRRLSYYLAWFLPHVMFPHVISLIGGVALFVAARGGSLGFGASWQW